MLLLPIKQFTYLPHKHSSSVLDYSSFINRHTLSAPLALSSISLPKLFFHDIPIYTTIDWNIDLLTQTSRYWDYTALSLNKSLWEKVFPEFHRNSEHTIEILEYFLKGDVKS